MSYFYEKPTNTAARASNNSERSRWRYDGVDPELVADPFDVLQASLQQKEAAARRELAVNEARQAVQESFEN